MQIGIIYFSQTGATAELAQSIRDGIRDSGVAEVFSYQIQAEDILAGRFRRQDVLAALDDCDAILFGSPTYMGGVAAQFKAFADASSERWSGQRWAGKVAAGFTCGNGPNGDQGMTLQYLSILAMQHGMVWVGVDAAHGWRDYGVNRFGTQTGVVAHAPGSKVHETDLATAAFLGRRVARVTAQMRQGLATCDV